MSLPALTITHAAPTLEEARAAWLSNEGRLKEGKRAQARHLHPLYLAWCTANALTSRLQFIQWLTGEDRPPNRYYAYLSAGLALSRGLDYGLGVSDLAVIGRALLAGRTVGDVQEALETGGIAVLRSELEEKRQEGQVSLPTAELPAVREAITRVSDSESLPGPESLALIVQAHEALPPTIRAAALRAARDGSPLEDAAREVVRAMLDPHVYLSGRGCAVPGCGITPAQLHHLRAEPDARFRTETVLLALCTRHHIPRPHDTTDAIHAATQAQWAERHFGSEAAMWRHVARAYAAHAHQEDV